jgi:hypothetical protein
METNLVKFNEERDEALKGLEKCDVLLMDSEIRQLGYAQVSFTEATDGRDEHELNVYSKEGKRMVFLQTYAEREGGLYFQSLFADKDTVDELEKPLVIRSLGEPSTFLAETILHFRGIKIPGTERLFPDMSIYKGCHHYLTISHDPALAGIAISNYKSMVTGSEGLADRKADERTEQVLNGIIILNLKTH